MDSELVEAARVLAEHSILLLMLGVAVISAGAAAIVWAARLAARHRNALTERGAWLLAQAGRVPLIDRAITGSRLTLPSRYLVVHLVSGLVAVSAAVAFLVVAEEVFAGREVAMFDAAFADALRENASPHLRQIFRRITWLGSGEVLLAATVAVAIGLLIKRHYVLALGWVLAQAGGVVLIIVLKNAFGRARPESADSRLFESWSFPSGHALGTFVFCGLAAYLLIRSTRSVALTAAIAAAALAWCLIIGFTRLYLGVHFASDVVAGLIGGTAWVAVCVSGIEAGLRRSRSGSAAG